MAAALATSSSPVTPRPITTTICFSSNTHSNTSTRIHHPHLKTGHSRPVLTTNRASAEAGHVVTDQTTQEQKGGRLVNISEHQLSSRHQEGEEQVEDSSKVEDEGPRFRDERWKKGTWDLNMFVNNGRMDWDSVITAEARRRRFLEVYPEAATNEEPVLFRTSIIPWWAWLQRSHLPEAELLNGRAAMIGFFMAYLVDVLTGLDMVGQNGNLVCKAGLFVTVVGVLLFRRNQDFLTLRKLADEATFYDKQWQSSWQDSDSNSTRK